MSFTMDKRVAGEFDAVVDETTDALSEEGFGILCDINIQQAFAEKLDLDDDYRRYRILGACNPSLAHHALESELRLGALLPCNVVVYETDEGAVGVSAVDPTVLLGVVDNSELDEVAADVRDRFVRVLNRLPAATDE
ncbi:DUF302 domain-containing protein [Halorarum halophilum]|uniref:DUF302 domain-containing protein n=1 Tax=Halorarum halophilum TaxID=2743090 RepID=A0A7D5KE39_9EURY|nr:DUF302 domain-containing protein [Halobaculum halophilum]QLG26516.1 DUF302 domain-containing protein [Halobaculum halophilum]